MKQNIGILTLGCHKNTVDSEKLAAIINPNLYNIYFLETVQPVDILIINTCGFILDAKKESIDTILEAIELKYKKKINQIIVTGCLTTRYYNELKSELSEVDYFFTLNETKSIISILNKNKNIFKPNNIRILSTPSHYAYLKIAEGCNRKCSFCAIPKIRGKYKSEDIDSLYNEAKELANKGVKELILVAQDLTYYGYDLKRKSLLAELLKKLSTINNIEWIRLHYTYPQFFTNELIEEINNNAKICKYIDLPIQHISNKILRLMNRKPEKEKLIELLYKLRNKINGLHLRTTVLVGHPGETKKDFDELVRFISEFQFEKLGAFKYSHEDNTIAALKLKDSIPEKIKNERLAKIMEIQQEISYKKNQKFIGTTKKVIIDREENDFLIGRTQYDSPEIDNEVLIKKNSKYKVGNFYDIKIIDSFEFDLIGE